MYWDKGKYNVKGNALNNMKAFLDEVKPGGLGFDYWVTLKKDEKVEDILTAFWYDVSLYYKTLHNVTQATGIPLNEFIEDLAGYALERDLNGIYKMIMYLGGPVRVLGATLPNVKTYFDYVSITVKINTDGLLVFSASMPEEFIDFHIPADKGAITGILKVCGYKLNGYNILALKKEKEKSSYTIELNYSKK